MTRWESSSRPLFVRTVWRDGHHHVVLHDDAPHPTARSSRRSVSSTKSQRGAKKTQLKPETTNFKVPTVKLLLASLRNQNKRCKTELPRNFIKTPVTIDIVPSDSVRYSDINKQVSFDDVRQHRLSTKTTSFDVGLTTPPPFSYDSYHADPCITDLSERVIIWLDLAIQNHKQFKSLDVKKRTATAHAQTCHVTRAEPPKIEVKEETPRRDRQLTPLVTSRIEFDDMSEMAIQRNDRIRNTAKRQLHIFLPSLPKKSSSSSLLSSKASSFQTNKI